MFREALTSKLNGRSPRRTRASLAARLGSGSLLVAAALSAGCDPDYPINTITVTTDTGTVTRNTGDNHTVALAYDQLGSAFGGIGKTLEFTAPPNGAFNLTPQQQEVIAFDFSWHLESQGPLYERPLFLDGFNAYNSQMGHGLLQMGSPANYPFSFQPLHVVRYWHGHCGIRLGWTSGTFPLFSLLDEQIGKAIACGAKWPTKPDPECVTNDPVAAPCGRVPDLQFLQGLLSVSVSAESVEYQPQFLSQNSIEHMGFIIMNEYNVHFAPITSESTNTSTVPCRT